MSQLAGSNEEKTDYEVRGTLPRRSARPKRLACPAVSLLKCVQYASFHSRVRDEFLALEIFDNLRAARELTAAWKEDYNHRRPHGSLGYQTPAEFAAAGCVPAGLPLKESTSSPREHSPRTSGQLPQPIPS